VKWIFSNWLFSTRGSTLFSALSQEDTAARTRREGQTLFDPDADPKKVKRAVRGIFEIRGSRKMQRYLLPGLTRILFGSFVMLEGFIIWTRP